MKPIKDYEGYFINERGEVWSTVKNPHRMLKQANDGRGYKNVTVYSNSMKKIYKVHRLVAEAYISNPLNLPVVNHINGVKNDNRVENLEWTTQQRNSELANAKMHLVEVIATGEVLEVFNIKKWCRDNGLHYCLLWGTKKPQHHQHKGYRLL